MVEERKCLSQGAEKCSESAIVSPKPAPYLLKVSELSEPFPNILQKQTWREGWVVGITLFLEQSDQHVFFPPPD